MSRKKKSRLKGYADLSDMPEDERIRTFCRYITEKRIVAAVYVDDEPGKAERYIRKIKEWFPLLTIQGTFPGCPLPGITMIKIGPPNQN